MPVEDISASAGLCGDVRPLSSHDDRGALGCGADRPPEHLEQLAPDAGAVAGEVGRRRRPSRQVGLDLERAGRRRRAGSRRRPADRRGGRHRRPRARRGSPPAPCREAPDIRPSVTSATLKPAILQHRQRRGQRMQLRHAVRLRPLEAHHDHAVAGELAGLEGGLHRLLVVEDAGRRLDHVPLRRHGRDLDHAAPEIAVQLDQPAGRLERVGRRAAGSCRSGSRAGPAPRRARPSFSLGSIV